MCQHIGRFITISEISKSASTSVRSSKFYLRTTVARPLCLRILYWETSKEYSTIMLMFVKKDDCVTLGKLLIDMPSHINLFLLRLHFVPTTLVTRVGNFLFRIRPSPHCAVLTNYFDLTQVCIWLFSNIDRRNSGADTYSKGIAVTSSCFCHFPTQFVHGCLSFHIF